MINVQIAITNVLMYYAHVSLEPEPSASPHVMVTFVNETFAIVSWKPLDCCKQNGVITGYRLRVEVEECSGQSFQIGLNGQNVTSYILDTLTPHTQYTAQVAAVNAAGLGPFSIAMPFSTK